MEHHGLQFNESQGLRFIKIMNRVIRKSEQHADFVAKETAEAALYEYQTTGGLFRMGGMNDALYEIIMNYGGLFDGIFARRILKGNFNGISNQVAVNETRINENKFYQNNSLITN